MIITNLSDSEDNRRAYCFDRNIADGGRYPAIDILKSVSRMMPDCNTDDENRIVSKARSLLASYGRHDKIGGLQKRK